VLGEVIPGLRRWMKNPFIDLLVTLAIAGGIAFAVQLWVVKPYRIPSGSMLETFQLGDRVLAARFLYRFTDPDRGDIIVFHPNGQGDDAYLTDTAASVVFVKRLIGLPGEWVQAKGGKVQVCTGPQGKGCRTLSEPYVSSTQDPFGPIPIPEGEYFMMGDNRAQSDDSRVWGTISRDQMIGRAFMIYWPPTHLGFF
jgi:signal peptidase I